MPPCRGATVLALTLTMVCVSSAQKPRDRDEAARLNDLGVALMNQRYTEKAIEKFNEALKRDPSLFVARTNSAIALLNLPDLPKTEDVLKEAVAKHARDPRIWYARQERTNR
jgi:Flp pilus assembly protein TadD